VGMASLAISQGAFQGTFMFTIGMNAVKILYLGCVVMGFHFAQADILFLVILIKAFAAAYLIWMGIEGLRHSDVDMTLPGQDKPLRMWDNIRTGITLSLANPLEILFFAGVVPTVVDVSAVTFETFLIFSAIIIVIETGVAMAYAIPLSYSRNFLNPRVMEKVNFISNLMLIGVGLIIGWSAMPAADILSVFQK